MGDRSTSGRRALRLALALLAVGLPLAGTGALRHSAAADSASAAELSLRDPATALRAAESAMSAGNVEEGLRLLAEISNRYPIVADYADRRRARELLARGDPAGAASVAREALQTHSESPLRAGFYAMLGDARALLGDADGARSAWRSAIDDTRSDSERARLRLQIARSYEDAGDLRSARDAYLSIWVSHPTREEGEVAGVRLDALPERAGPTRSGRDWRRRGDKLFRARRNEEALEAYAQALAGELSRSERRRTQRQQAQTLFRMRSYPAAVEAFAKLPQVDDVPIWHARSLARADRVLESIDEFERLSRTRRDAIGTRATYLAALLLDGRGFSDRARRHYERIASRRSSAGLRGAALWRLGWAAYREGNYEEALGYLDRLVRALGPRSGVDALRERYWRARALDKTGSPAARAEFTAIALEYPFSYYGLRARERADREAPARMRVLAASRAKETSKRKALPREDLERPRILLEAGLLDDARSELARARRNARTASDRLEIAQLLADAGDFNEAQKAAIGHGTSELARGPVPGSEGTWWHAWPYAYGDVVERGTAAPGSVEPGLVLAIMREESGYRPGVRSAVGARGLMQIMPDTGTRLAKGIGIARFDPEELFDPEVNVILGSYYLTQLSNRFPDRLSAAIASYNAGPEVVQEWLEERPEMDDDEWVESIPYDQTRSYVKRVLRSLHAYRVLY